MEYIPKHKERVLYHSLAIMDSDFYTDPLDDFSEYRDISLYEVWEYCLSSVVFVILATLFYEARRKQRRG
jgi:hypothetical protein